MMSHSPRITARVDPDTQALLSEATALSGISSINSFVLNAAIDKAKGIVERKHTLKLSQKDSILLLKLFHVYNKHHNAITTKHNGDYNTAG